jgi:MGT family glycosyltransferase
MSRILFTVWPFSGHVNPCVPVGLALRQLGHEVGFYTQKLWRPTLEPLGFRVFPFDALDREMNAITETAGDGAELLRETSEYFSGVGESRWQRLRKARRVLTRLSAGTIPAQMHDLDQVIRAWGPDVIVTDAMMWAPIAVLHERGSQPVAVFCFYAGCLIPAPGAPPPGFGLPPAAGLGTRTVNRVARALSSLLNRGLRAQLNEIRGCYGLQPMGTSLSDYSRRLPLYLVSTAPELDYNRSDLPESVRYVGPCLWDAEPGFADQRWVDELPSHPPVVYVSEGTAQVRKPLLLPAAIEGLASLPVQLVATTGPHRQPDFGALPANVKAVQWVRHSEMFRKTSVVVTNGGSSTVRQALALGVPLVVVPMEWDQFENAQRVSFVGAGIRLSVSACTPARLREAVLTVLQNPRYAESARRIAGIFSRCGQAREAAGLIAGLAGSRMRMTGHPAVRGDIFMKSFRSQA